MFKTTYDFNEEIEVQALSEPTEIDFDALIMKSGKADDINLTYDLTNVDFTKIGKYTMTITYKDVNDDEKTREIDVKVIDSVKPVLSGCDDLLFLVGSQEPNWLEGITANDNYDGDITLTLHNVDKSSVDMNTTGSYEVIYTVQDSSGNEGRETITVTIAEKLNLTVSFKDYDGTLLKEETIAYGNAATAPAEPSRVGHTFSGWDKTYDVITEDTIISATYTPNSYTVTFKDYDGTVLDTQVIEYEKNATAPNNPSRVGYTFSNWDKTFNQITADTIVTAIYNINTYTVTFKDYDGTILDTQTIEYGKNATAPNDPSRAHFTFNGWDTAFNQISGNTIVTATYTPVQYTVTFKDYDGSILESQSVDYGTSAITPSDPSRVGYTFSNWDKTFNQITADTIVTAIYNINTYTVTFKDHDGTILSTQTIEYGKNATAPNDPSRAHYTFNGWDTAFNQISGNTIVTATYTPVQYTVTFKDYDGSILEAQSVDYGTSAITPSDPSRIGYTFNGWDKTFDHIIGVTTINATYSINQYRITFDSDGGSSVIAITAYYQDNIIKPTDPIKDGYTFWGWYKDSSYNNAFDFTNMQAEDITVFAKWLKNPEISLSDDVTSFSISTSINIVDADHRITGKIIAEIYQNDVKLNQETVLGLGNNEVQFINLTPNTNYEIKVISYLDNDLHETHLLTQTYTTVPIEPTATTTLGTITSYSIDFSINLLDPNNQLSGDAVAVLYQLVNSEYINTNKQLVLNVGLNDLSFNALTPNTMYKIYVIDGGSILSESEGVLTITTIESVADLKNIQNNLNGSYQLNNDIDLTGVTWNSLGVFNGQLNGNGYKIIGLTQPLFTEITSLASVLDLGLNVDINLSSNLQNLGILTNINGGLIIHSYVIGNLTISNTIIDASIGGLVGLNTGTIENSYTSIFMDISGSAASIGGLVGVNNGVIKNTYSIGEITATNSQVGGLVGVMGTASNIPLIMNSYSSSHLTLIVDTNGIAGGLIASMSKGTIENSVSSGNIETIGDIASVQIGKFIGNSTIDVVITNSYANINQIIVQNGNDVSTSILDEVNGEFIESRHFYIELSFFENQLSWDSTIWNLALGYLPQLNHVDGQIDQIVAGINDLDIYGVGNITIQYGTSVDLLENVYGFDIMDGLLDVEVNISDTANLDYGTYPIIYTVFDNNQNKVIKQATLLVINNDIRSDFTISSVQYISNLDQPMTSIDQFDDYVYTMLENGYTEYTLYCDTNYFSCLDLKSDSEISVVGDVMFFVHSYMRSQRFSFGFSEQYIIVKLTDITYSEQYKNVIDETVEQILHDIILPGMTELQKIRTIHDYIIKGVEYNDACLIDQSECNNSFNAYSVFFEGITVCDGYSQAFDIMARKLGIDTYRIRSIPEGEHAWNVVNINGEWLHLDLTWNDSGGNTVSDTYYLITTEELHRNDQTTAHQYDDAIFSNIS